MDKTGAQDGKPTSGCLPPFLKWVLAIVACLVLLLLVIVGVVAGPDQFRTVPEPPDPVELLSQYLPAPRPVVTPCSCANLA